jgi:hypothetical protein
MVLNVNLRDGTGGNYAARCTSRNELVTNKYDYSLSYTVEADLINTAYNFVGPVAGKRFVITDILIYANKNVGAGDATVEIYEADGSTNTTVTKSVLKTEMLKQTARDLTGLSMIVTEGKWLNIKTDDDDIFATVMGYYVPA